MGVNCICNRMDARAVEYVMRDTSSARVKIAGLQIDYLNFARLVLETRQKLHFIKKNGEKGK